MAAGKGTLTAMQRRVLHFFQQHPHAVETLRGIARWMDAEKETVAEAIHGLLKKKWLLADETARFTGYALTRNERSLAQIRSALETI